MDDTQPLIEHLIELRSRLIRTLLGLLLCFVALVPFSEQLYTFVAEPLMSNLPAGNQMIATDVIAPFFVPMKVTLMLAFLASLPNTLWQVWAFVAPALYQNEKKLVLPLVVSTVLLFFAGMAFAFYLVFPTMFKFLAHVTPEGVSMATDIDKYLSFILGMFVAFGITFETPVIVVLLCRMGVVSLAQLRAARSYVIVGAFVVAAIVTPPDVISQIMLAIPIIVLYEAGVQVCRFVRPKAVELVEVVDEQ